MKHFYLLILAFMASVVTANATEVEDYSIDWTAQTEYNLWAPDEVKSNISVSFEDGLVAKNEKEQENYLFQYQGASNLGLKAGTDYTLKIVVKGSAEGKMHLGIGDWGKLAESDINFTTSEKEYTVNFTATVDGGFLLCQSGAFVGTTSIKSVKITHEEGVFDGNIFLRYTSKAGTNLWDYQATYTLPTALEKGSNYTLSMKARASEPIDELGFWPIWNASDNKNQWGGSNDVQYEAAQKVTTGWTTLTWNFTANFPIDCLQFCFGKFGGTLDFDDIVLTKEGSNDNIIENGEFTTTSTKGWGNNWNGPTFEIVKETAAEAPVVTINNNNLASFSNATAVTVPEDVVIYIATKSDANSVSLKKVSGNVIPANQGVILYSATPGKKQLINGGTSSADFSGNILKATGSNKVTADDNTFALLTDEQAFAKVEKGTDIPANKAYIETEAGAKLNVVFDGEVTGIKSVEKANNTVQSQYNLAGQKVGNNYKGIVIVNGKKIIRK